MHIWKSFSHSFLLQLGIYIYFVFFMQKKVLFFNFCHHFVNLTNKIYDTLKVIHMLFYFLCFSFRGFVPWDVTLWSHKYTNFEFKSKNCFKNIMLKKKWHFKLFLNILNKCFQHIPLWILQILLNDFDVQNVTFLNVM